MSARCPLFFTPHAVERAKERYGLKLSPSDMRRIYDDCLDGRALKIRVGDCYSSTYVMVWNDIRIIPVIKNDCLMTFLPSNAIVAGAGIKHSKKHYGGKQVGAVSRFARGRGVERRSPRSMNQILDRELENA